MSYSKTYDKHNNSSTHLNTTGTFVTGSPIFTGDPLTNGYPNIISTTIDSRYHNQAGVMRLYAAENVVAFLTGVKGYGVNTDKELNTTFSVYTDDNKTYKFDIGEFHYAMFEGEKVYTTQSGRSYEQSQADRLAAKRAKEAKERLEREKEYKINNFDSLAEKYDNLILQRYKDSNLQDLLTQVLDIISADYPIQSKDVIRLPEFVRKALYANKKKYKRRYK